MKKIKITLLSLVLLFESFNVFCQHKISIIDSTKDGQIKFAKVLSTIHSNTSKDSKKFLKEVLRSSENEDFYLYKNIKDVKGMIHEKFQQTFKGIKVEFGEYIVHKDITNNIFAINGDFKRIPNDFGIVCKLKYEEAIDLIKKKSKYQLLKLPVSQYTEGQSVQSSKEYEVVIVIGNDNKYHLAYKVNLMSNIFDNFLGYIDCATGDIVFQQPLTCDNNVPGSAATLYSGPVSLTTDTYTGGYRLFESMEGNNMAHIHTYNFNRAPAYFVDEVPIGIANASVFTDNDNNWTAAEYNNENHDIAALDSHWGCEKTFGYFWSVFNRWSYDGSGSVITDYVHVRTRDRDYPDIIMNMDNAFWNDTYKALFLGDGNTWNPVVSLDGIAHEFAHGVCFSAVGNGTGLIYAKESGALNESLSDMWGACVEDWATDDKQTWIMGEELIANGLRSMENPNNHWNHQPDTYQSTSNFWFPVTNCTPSNLNDKCGVHTNSGVGNRWFFLLVNGGIDATDFGNHYVVSGIGITKAAQIIYSMETSYLSPTSTYSDARTLSIAASTALFGANSLETTSVTNAWYAVGIGSEVPQYYSGSYFVCYPSTTTYSFPTEFNGYNITWSTSNNIEIISGQGTTSIVVRKTSSSSNGTGNITAVYNHGSGNKTLQRTVWVGLPTFYEIQGPSSGTVYNTYMFDAIQYNPNAAASYSWSLFPSFGNPVYNYGHYADITFNVPWGPYQVSVQVQNGCGTLYGYHDIGIGEEGLLYSNDSFDKEINTQTNSKITNTTLNKQNDISAKEDIKYILSPNPASEEVRVTIIKGFNIETTLGTNIPDFNVQVHNLRGEIYYEEKKSGLPFTFPVRNLKDGIYIVSITYGKQKQSMQLIVKH